MVKNFKGLISSFLMHNFTPEKISSRDKCDKPVKVFTQLIKHKPISQCTLGGLGILIKKMFKLASTLSF